MSHKFGQISRRWIVVSLMAIMATAALSTPARAQDALSKDAAAAVKAAFIADLDGLKTKFVGLAEAFPQDKYSWRPMDGVRSVSEVFVLAASEGYAFIPNGFGGKANTEGAAAVRGATDKAKIVESLNQAFAYAKAQVEAADPATLTGKRPVMGQSRNTVEIAGAIAGDLHEHLGQMIAYARMNHIVPPWSK